MPLLTGELVPYDALNEWQVLWAVVVGTALGFGLLPALWVATVGGWRSSVGVGRRVRDAPVGWWGIWVTAIGVVTMSWAGGARSAVLPWSGSVSAVLVGGVASAVTW